MTYSAKALLGSVVLTCCLLTGCSKDTPPAQPNYGDSALVVEGTEVWRTVTWASRGAFDKQDVNRDQYLDVAEFTAKTQREGIARRAIKIFAILDTNDNDKLSWEEYSKRPGEAQVVNLDADENGTVSAAEYGALKPHLLENGQLEAWCAVIDSDGNGELSAEELDIRPRVLTFLDKDRDGDGRVSQAEFANIKKKSPSREDIRKNLEQFQSRDKDKNGHLSLREFFPEPGLASFWAMDGDLDGTVSSSEFADSDQFSHLDKEASAIFAILDRDQDGECELHEYESRSDEVMLAQVDRNNDSYLSREEFLTLSLTTNWNWLGKRIFHVADEDYDGRLTVDEFASRPSAGSLTEEQKKDVSAVELAFRRMDRDGNGQIVIEELLTEEVTRNLPEAGRGMFEVVDKNGDQAIMLDEFKSAKGGLQFLIWDVDRDGLLNQAEFHDGQVPGGSMERAAAILAALDDDDDAMLSLEETRDIWARARFLMSDRDDDGSVTLEEFGKNRRNRMSEEGIVASFDSYDINGDALLDAEEMETRPLLDGFQQKDTNVDLHLTIEEVLKGAKDDQDIEERTKGFKERDVSCDGRVSLREEFYTPHDAKFWAMDTSNDMVVNAAEFGAAKYTQNFTDCSAAFGALDCNSNGAIDIAEFRRRPGNVLAVFGGATSPWSGRNNVKFEKLDANGDGVVVASEVYSRDAVPDIAERFLKELEAMDTDESGQVTFAEFKARKSGFLFPCIDTDHDGTISSAEFQNAEMPWASDARTAEVLSAADANGDGKLDPNELAGRRQSAHLMLYDWDEDDRICREEFAGLFPRLLEDGRFEQIFTNCDRDHDGKLSKDEFDRESITRDFIESDSDDTKTSPTDTADAADTAGQ